MHGLVRVEYIGGAEDDNKKTMSRVNKDSKEVPPLSLSEAGEEVDEVSETQPQKTRVVWEVKGTADEFAKGKVVDLANAISVFGSEKANKGIISKITMLSAWSDASEPITVSLNLFNHGDEELSVKNKIGWLHSPQNTDFGTRVVGGSNGFKNVVALMPYENTRQEVTIYHPDDPINTRYLEQYGGLSRESIRENVVPFKDEGVYLVDQSHVILQLIQNNWDSLGIDVQNEPRFNGKYVQIPCAVFDRVAEDLEKQVLAKMPFTDLTSLQAKFTAKRAKDWSDAETPARAVIEMQFEYQFPPEQTKPAV